MVGCFDCFLKTLVIFLSLVKLYQKIVYWVG